LGQSQFLLIVVGVLIILLAIFAGSGLFKSSETDANRSAIVSDINQIAHLAARYYAKPSALNGGGHSYMGFELPNKFKADLNGQYRVSAMNATTLQIVGLSALDTDNTVTTHIDSYGKALNWSFTGDFR
jgi:hypothetical protein